MTGDDPNTIPDTKDQLDGSVHCQSSDCKRRPILRCVHGWWCDIHVATHAEQAGRCEDLLTEINRIAGLLQHASSPDLEGAKVLLDEWKWRQDQCWTSLRQYSVAAVTVSIVPYVKPDIIGNLGRLVLIFPLLGWLIFVVAAWFFASEYVRAKPVEVRYRQLLGWYSPDPERVNWFKNAARIGSISKTTIWALLVSSAILSMFNAVVLNRLLGRLHLVSDPPFPEGYVYLTCMGLIAFHFVLFGIVAGKWSAGRSKRL